MTNIIRSPIRDFVRSPLSSPIAGGGGPVVPDPVTAAITGQTANPTYGPTAQTGVPLTGVITGLVGGETIVHRWFIGVAQIAGAGAAEFTPTIGTNVDDLDLIQYAPTVDGVEVRSADARVRQVPPVASNAIADQTYTVGDGPQTVDASVDFTGVGLSYSVTGATINSSTGVVTINPVVEVVDSPVVITASNSGGSVASAFVYTVTAVVIGDFTVTPQFVIGTTTYPDVQGPQTGTLTSVPGATGVVLAVSLTGTGEFPITVDGEVPTLIAIQDHPEHMRSVRFYHTSKIAGDVVVVAPATRGNYVRVMAFHLTGASVRSWTSASYIPDLSSTTEDTTGGVTDLPYDSGGLVIGLYTRDYGAFPGATPVGFISAGIMSENFFYYQDFASPGTASPSHYYHKDATWGMQLVVSLSQQPAERVTINEPVISGFVYPLDLSRSVAVVPVTGVYNGGAKAIEARVINDSDAEVVPWTAVAESTVNGDYSGALTVPASSAACRLQVRVSETSVIATQVLPWYTGLHIVAIGQSNLGGFFINAELPMPASVPQGCVYDARTVSFNTQNGNGVRRFFSELLARTGLPAMVILSYQSGATVNYFMPGDTICDAAVAAISDMHSTLHAIMWHQGEGEGDAAAAVNVTSYANSISAIHAALASAAGLTVSDVPFVLSSLTTYGGTGGSGDINGRWTAIDECHKQLPSLLPNVHWSDSWKDASRSDSFHCYGESYARRAVRVAHNIAYHLGYETTPGRFDIASVAATSGTTTTVTVAHSLGTDIEIKGVTHLAGNSNLTDETVITGFEVSDDNWATSKSCTGVRTNATTITLAHDSISTTGRKLRYLYGRNPDVSGIVRDNGPLHSVLTHERSLDAV